MRLSIIGVTGHICICHGLYGSSDGFYQDGPRSGCKETTVGDNQNKYIRCQIIFSM